MFTLEELYGVSREEFFNNAPFNMKEYIASIEYELAALRAHKIDVQTIYRSTAKMHVELMYEANLLQEIDKRIKRKEEKLQALTDQPSELTITVEDDGTVIATLIKDGEYHEEVYDLTSYRSIPRLIHELERETNVSATVIQVKPKLVSYVPDLLALAGIALTLFVLARF